MDDNDMSRYCTTTSNIYREAGGFCPLDRAVGKTKSQKHVSLGINLYQRLDGPATGRPSVTGSGLAEARTLKA